MRIGAVVLALAIAGCTTGPGGERYFAVLSGGNYDPAIVTTAGGSVSLHLSGGVLSYDVLVQFGSGVTAAHLHAGAAGEDGPVLATMYNGPTTGLLNGRLTSGEWRAADLAGVTMDSLRTLLRNGHAYADVHTTSYPDGELRGQVTIE